MAGRSQTIGKAVVWWICTHAFNWQNTSSGLRAEALCGGEHVCPRPVLDDDGAALLRYGRDGVILIASQLHLAENSLVSVLWREGWLGNGIRGQHLLIAG